MSVQSRNAVPTPSRGFPSVSPRVRRHVRPGAVGVHALMSAEQLAALRSVKPGRHRADTVARANGGQQ